MNELVALEDPALDLNPPGRRRYRLSAAGPRGASMNMYAHLHEHRAPIFKILDVAVAVAAVATIPVTVLQLRGDPNAWILAVDWLIWSTFVAEYLVMLALP